MVLESSVAIRSAVIAGAGPAVLSVLVVERDIERGALVPVRILGRRLRRPITAVWRGRREALTELSRTLLAVAR
jgi:DNA-binding transcriptional LysR family regulator